MNTLRTSRNPFTGMREYYIAPEQDYSYVAPETEEHKKARLGLQKHRQTCLKNKLNRKRR